MEKNQKDLSEKEYVARFLVEAYREGLIPYNGLIRKIELHRRFEKYLSENSYSNIGRYQIGELLEKHEFLLSFQSKNAIRNYKINKIILRDFLDKVIDELDEVHIKKGPQLNAILLTDEIETIELDPNSEPKQLQFECNIQQFPKTKFDLSNYGCYVCQQNFVDDNLYNKHIAYHGESTNFEYLYESGHEKLSQKIFISYQECKDSYYLSIKIDNHNEDLIIEKIIIVRPESMIYMEDDKVPFHLNQNDSYSFFVDQHLFEIGVENAMIFVYKIKNPDLSQYRCIEQHHLLTYEPFGGGILNYTSALLPQHGILKFKNKMRPYIILETIRNIFKNKNRTDADFQSLPARFQLYLQNKELNSSNFNCVYQILLQFEELETIELYDKLKQFNTNIRGFGRDFSVFLRKVDDINIEDLLMPGDQVILVKENSTNSNMKKKRYTGRIDRVYGKHVYFSCERGRDISKTACYNITFKPSSMQIQYQRRAADTIESCKHIKTLLYPFDNVETQESTINISTWYNKQITTNTKQKETVNNILFDGNYHVPFIVFGPPGTGKTTTIVEAIMQLWRAKESNYILVTADSNTACDEVAKRLAKIFSDVAPNERNFLRIYAARWEKSIDLLESAVVESSNLCYDSHFLPSLESMKMYRIIILTTFMAGKYVAAGIGETHFTHVFIDECGACTETSSLTAIAGLVSKQTKVILSGDPKQLGPVIKSQLSSDLGLSQSLLERLMNRKCYEYNVTTREYNRNIQGRLINNYRTHPKILELFNTLYYNNELKACVPKSISNLGLSYNRLPNPDCPLAFHAVMGESKRFDKNPSLCNFKEINAVMRYTKYLMYFGINGRTISESDIGIISPYKLQCNLIRNRLNERRWYKIEVGSVEAFQGQEKSIIILSMVRANTKTLGFLDNKKRLNVALSRAQSMLIIIGDPKTLEMMEDFCYVMKYCKDNRACVGTRFIFQNKDETDNNINNQLIKDITEANSEIRKLTISTVSNLDSKKNISNSQVNNKKERNNLDDSVKMVINDSMVKKAIPVRVAAISPNRRVDKANSNVQIQPLIPYDDLYNFPKLPLFNINNVSANKSTSALNSSHNLLDPSPRAVAISPVRNPETISSSAISTGTSTPYNYSNSGTTASSAINSVTNLPSTSPRTVAISPVRNPETISSSAISTRTSTPYNYSNSGTTASSAINSVTNLPSTSARVGAISPVRNPETISSSAISARTSTPYNYSYSSTTASSANNSVTNLPSTSARVGAISPVRNPETISSSAISARTSTPYNYSYSSTTASSANNSVTNLPSTSARVGATSPVSNPGTSFSTASSAGTSTPYNYGYSSTTASSPFYSINDYVTSNRNFEKPKKKSTCTLC